MRLESHPFLEFDRGEKVTFYYNGQAIEAYCHETIAAALHAAGIRQFGASAVMHQPRGLFCGNGNCQSCLMTVDGVTNVRICITTCRDGMVVVSQNAEGGGLK